MTGILIRKELSQIKKMYLTNKRKNRQGGKGMFIFLICIYFFLMLSMGALESAFAFSLLPEGEGGLYYFFITMMAFLVGIIGSVFTTAEILFRAKDNEFLMAMPIPPSKIIIARMTSVFAMGMIYELLVILPGLLIYLIIGGFTVVKFLFGIIGIILLAFVILAFSCLFGWILAIIMAKLSNKKILTVIISVVFIGLFIYIRFMANSFFRNLIENARAIGESIKGWGYPFYQLGKGMDGNPLSLLIFAGISAVLFGLTCWLISKSFNRIVNIKPKEKQVQFKTAQIRTSSADKALFTKELHRFTSSPNYMLNCGLGILLLVAAMIMAIIMSGSIRDLIAQIGGNMFNGRALPALVLAFAVCMLTGFTDISAPSISLEGRYVWVLQAMPVTPMQVIMAKFKMAAVFTAVPAIICVIVTEAVTGAGILTVILSALLLAVYSVFTVLLGLRFDLGKPLMDWTNETQPVKQNMSVLFTMLIGMLSPLVPVGLYLIAGIFIGAEVYLAVWIIIYAFLAFIIFNWIRKKGSAIFSRLGQ